MTEIRVERLTKSFKQLKAVDDVSFRFTESDVTCLLGPSGCGKTTLMRMIAGLETPTSGEVYFGEQRVTRLKPSERDIGMVFQYPVVYRGISVYRNIELPLLGEKLTKAERERRIESVAEILNLREHLDMDITRSGRIPTTTRPGGSPLTSTGVIEGKRGDSSISPPGWDSIVASKKFIPGLPKNQPPN